MSKFQLKPWNRGITDAELLDDLRRVAQILGSQTVRYSEYPVHGRCASRVFETRFGSWNEALLAAGLQVGRRQDIFDVELFENMQHVWVVYGRQPRREEMARPTSAFAKGTYEHRFGGWRKALEAFVNYADGGASQQAPLPSRRSPVNGARFPDLRVRWRVLNRDSFRCRSCGRSPAAEFGVVLHVDHVVPWSKGGTSDEQNLQTLCERCNLGKSDALPPDA